MNRRNSDEKHRLSIEDDYIELLNEVDIDEFEDVYSDSSNDIYSDSSKDIYFNKKRGNTEGIYVNKHNHRSSDNIYSYSTDSRQPTRETPVVQIERNYDVFDEDEDDVSDYESRHSRRPRRKKHRFLKFVAVMLALVIGIGFGAYTLAKSVVSSVTEGFVQAEEIEHINGGVGLVSESHVKNILLIGCDKEKSGASRSDSMIIVSVNSNTGKISVVSILRDTHVEIPGYRKQKINAAHTYGGAQLLIQTIEHNFNIKIDDYATVDFDMFEALVDGLGGVTVDVSEAEANHMNDYFKLGQGNKPPKVIPGESVHLNGYQALCYARIRKLDSDFYRTERQRKIIAAIIETVKEKVVADGVNQLLEIAKNVAPNVQTTLSDDDIMALATSLALGILKSSGDGNELLVSAKIPFDDTWKYTSEWDGSSISIDLEQNRNLLYKLLYTDEPVLEEDTEE